MFDCLLVLYVDTCPNRVIPCQWCAVPISSNQYREHVAECNFKVIECPSKCGARVPDKDLKLHLSDTCARRFVPCQLGCAMKVRECDENRHFEVECGNRIVECLNRCHDRYEKVITMQFRQLDVHMHHDCEKVKLR